MGNKEIYTALIATSLWLNSCASEVPKPILASNSPTPLAEFTPTQIIPAETLVQPTPTVEQRFVVGGIYDAAHTPIKIIADVNFRLFLGHSFPIPSTYTGDLPFPSITGEALTEPGKLEDWIAAETNHIENPMVVIPVDLLRDTNEKTRHIILSTHSRQAGVPGELSREIFLWFYKHVGKEQDVVKKEEEKQKLFSQVVPFIIGDATYESHIVNVTYFSQEFWEGKDGSPWMQYPSEKVDYADSEKLGIPKEVTENLGENEILVTVVGCLPEFPFEIVVDKNNPDQAYYLNGRNRASVTYKISLDKPIQ